MHCKDHKMWNESRFNKHSTLRKITEEEFKVQNAVTLQEGCVFESVSIL
jgi:hypothetical protein